MAFNVNSPPKTGASAKKVPFSGKARMNDELEFHYSNLSQSCPVPSAFQKMPPPSRPSMRPLEPPPRLPVLK